MKFNYQKICSDILKELPQQRTRDIISRRFALSIPQSGTKAELPKRETLESIGQSYNITRERVRQIEEDGFKKIRNTAKKICQKQFQYFSERLKKFGGLKREDLLLADLAGTKSEPQVLFLLHLGEQFKRFPETESFHSFWAINKGAPELARQAINSFSQELKKKNQPLALASFQKDQSYIEISKNISKGPAGLYGFINWPEINPRGIKDRAFLVLKKENKPLHFVQVANFIQQQEKNKKPSLVKTVHNELIKDERFVLVGRGLYALKDWGYKPGVVKEVITDILKQSVKPLTQEEIVKQVATQRFVQKNTILLNLHDKKYFLRNSEGKYTIRED